MLTPQCCVQGYAFCDLSMLTPQRCTQSLPSHADTTSLHAVFSYQCWHRSAAPQFCPPMLTMQYCMQGYSYVPQGDNAALREALYSRGPIAVSIDAGQPSFRFYAQGGSVRPNPSP